MQANPKAIRDLWQPHTTLENAIQCLDNEWESLPYLTKTKISTTEIDQIITAKCSRALADFNRSPQGKLIELVGRSAVEWRGGAWNDRLSKICFHVGEEAHTAIFLEDETSVLTELHQRITILRTENTCRERTKEEVEEIVAFWWKLQEYRRWWLDRKGRYDTAEEELSNTEIQNVKRKWENAEMWWTLSEGQLAPGHLPSIYHAALNRRSGWAIAANAVIKFRMPQLPILEEQDGVTEHISIVDAFCRELVAWMKKMATTTVEYWRTPQYKEARRVSRRSSGLATTAKQSPSSVTE